MCFGVVEMGYTDKFSNFVCEGDSIACEIGGFEVIARIVRDDCTDAPDQRQDGFWPSLIKDAPGFIGPGPNHRQRYAEARANAEAVMAAWRRDELFYCGIVLSVSLAGVELDANAASLWGIEANYPGSDNAYLTATANDLLADAHKIGLRVAARLCAVFETAQSSL